MALSKFKRDEIAFELRHEDAEMGVYNKYNYRQASVLIDGKFWKKMPEAQALKAANTLRAKGKTVEVHYD